MFMRFEAEVRQIKSMVDNTYNVTFNLPEYQVAEAQALLAMIGELITIELQQVSIGKQYDDAIPTRTKRKSKRQTEA